MTSYFCYAVVVPIQATSGSPDGKTEQDIFPAEFSGKEGDRKGGQSPDKHEHGQAQQTAAKETQGLKNFKGYTFKDTDHCYVEHEMTDANGESHLIHTRAMSLTDSVDELKIGTGTDGKINPGGERIDSWGSLSADDLTMDARACALPKRRPKNALLKEEKLTKLENEHVDCQKDKGKAENRRGTHGKCSEHIHEFIKNLVHTQVSKEHIIKYFDAVIVYDKNDYSNVISFRNQLHSIVKSSLDEDLKIELFDSEEFAQSKIMVVEDVIDRCSVVLIYLSSNFNSPELHLFIEEAIGLSRLGYNDPEFQSGRTTSRRQWVLKPVHTEPRKSRDYKTPLGLLTVNGIDWFDRSSSHTLNQIKGMMQTAIMQRKQREVEGNTSRTYEHVFGSSPEMPPLGPPFNKPYESPTFRIPQLPKRQTAQLNSHPSNDAMSLIQGSPAFPSHQNESTTIRIDTQPSFPSGNQNTAYRDARQLLARETTSQGSGFAQQGRSSDLNTPSRYEPRNQADACLSYNMPPPYSPYTDQQFRQPPVGGQQFYQPLSPNVPAHQPGYIYQSAGLPNEGCFANQPPGHVPNYQTSAMHTWQSVGVPVQMDMRQSQVPVNSTATDVRGISQYDPYQSLHISRDALQSEPGNFLLDQRNDTPPTSQLSVVSQVSGNLITKTNLSADDDVEVDTRSQTDHARNYANDFENSTDESDYTSDSDSDMDFPVKRRVIQKVVNIVGCKTVQLGKRNRVKETGTKQETTDKPSKNQTEKCYRSFKEPSASNIAANEKLSTAYLKPAMNISVDNMSAENALSRGSHCNLESRYSLEKTALLSSDANMTSRRFEPVKTAQFKINTKFKVHNERVNVNENRTIDENEVYSPDDNISEDQLFGSGLLSLDTNSSSSYNRGFQPFSFSQGIQQTRDLINFLRPSLNINNLPEETLDCNTFVNNDID
ncbi:uncharacterized protein LOC123529032 isoform X2 [Mercenaria mercenaria]|nr:uncharacterized protein LOC123529032 isoform X2 [Mercenaria mercenaria]